MGPLPMIRTERILLSLGIFFLAARISGSNWGETEISGLTAAKIVNNALRLNQFYSQYF